MISDSLVPSRTLLTIRSKYLAALERLPSPLGDYGRCLFPRLGPDRWTLEWGLPLWLGEALPLSDGLSADLVWCNVLGLGYIRIQDDLIDGEVLQRDTPAAILLAHELYQLALLRYLDLFDRASPFWDYFGRFMDEWLSGTLLSLAPHAEGLREADLIDLAHRGAPLKICCAAALLLAGRAGDIPSASSALDHALAGVVLLDHLRDWVEDVNAGRYNAFVGHASRLDQDSENREENAARVHEMLLLGDGGRPYLELVLASLQRAQKSDLGTEVPQVAQYLEDLQARATVYYEGMVEDYRALLRQATSRLFRPTGEAVTTSPGEKGK